MNFDRLRQSAVWFAQAESDLRTACAVFSAPAPMRGQDVGCHLAALTAQSIEKSIKGYVLLNGAEPTLDHRPDKYLSALLTRDRPLLLHRRHQPHLSRLFDPPTRAAIRTLFDLTPGGSRASARPASTPNTEYPWKEDEMWTHAPVEHPLFGDSTACVAWLALAWRVTGGLRKLWIAVGRANPR